MSELEYDRWENFAKVVDKARTTCENSGNPQDDHFRDVTKMVQVGSNAQRPVADVMLTRYACYLIARK